MKPDEIVKAINDIEQEHNSKSKLTVFNSGSLCDCGIRFLATEASKMPEGGTYVEIGVFQGKSLTVATLGAPARCSLYGIDFRINPGWETRSKAHGFKYNEEKGYHTYQDKKIVIIKYKSLEAVEYWNSPINLLYIDGDHSYDMVKGDYFSWKPFVAKGGTIVFDDYFYNDHNRFLHKDVQRFIDEVVKKDREVGNCRHDDRLIAFDKL